MVSSSLRVSFRVALVVLLLFAAFYVGRPLYWKLSATVHEIRQKRQTVKEGISQFVLEAQKSVGWYHDESDSGFPEDQTAEKVGVFAINRRMLRAFVVDPNRNS